jgi:hypothetical protein
MPSARRNALTTSPPQAMIPTKPKMLLVRDERPRWIPRTKRIFGPFGAIACKPAGEPQNHVETETLP